MFNERTKIIIRLVTTHILLVPALLTLSVFINDDAFLLLSICQSLIVLVFLTGYWEFYGLRFRLIYSVFMECLLLAVLSMKIFSGMTPGISLVLVAVTGIIQAYLLYEIVKIFIVIFGHDKNRSEIIFPFRQGEYLVTDGGNSKKSRLMNYHFYSRVHKKNRTNYSMLFATDIVRTDNQRHRFLPSQNEDYPIFGEKVFSPVSGVVVKVENSINDNTPYSGGYPYNTGNTVVIRNGSRYFLLGHLKKGSVNVKIGDVINANDYLADAGNSGYSERSHIHMQLIESDTENFWKGIGISIGFKNKNLFKNRIIKLE